MRRLLYCLTGLLLVLPTLLTAQMRPLINGNNLSGWESYGGEAPFKVVDGEILGTAIVNTPNTFLCTQQKYGDFIVEMEFKNEAPLNSGVMARGQWRQDGDIRRIYGYQVEIDPSQRAYTGGVYDEQRRGWIYPVHYNPPARAAFKHGEWNRLRIEFIGNHLTTFVNGHAVANLVDNMDASGMICLQVHSIQEELAGKQMRWRNIMINDRPSKADRLYSSAPQYNLVPNSLTDWEMQHGWSLLWDGKTTDGWRGAKLDAFPRAGWKMQDGVLSVLASDGGESTNGGDIVTKRHYGDFELQFEFKPTKGANSGVKYYVDPSLNKGAGSAIGLEFQILDDKVHPDAKKGVAGNRTVGSLYDLITAEVLDTPRNKEMKVGEWNRGRIISKDGHVEHWLNGYKVVEFDRFSQTFKALVAYSKYKDWENFGRWPSGPILLQDHGDLVSFRSIKIKEL
ncbi:DUF1080 domain-containing protein [Lewinella sp. 4G2]|uniref:3-keto-disaccharide hydrolase n=1 Tax=Lewinella sp. 4G2 TaxID=1803372 RepID=UPI0007B4CF95|nr:DUF1080 domain-containing protein [Lewinella sp. 4G2]OAV44930.1 hypothetical protein A3850_010680 [Lewinella sp. 4G2]